jgi:hypothetical protein
MLRRLTDFSREIETEAEFGSGKVLSHSFQCLGAEPLNHSPWITDLGYVNGKTNPSLLDQLPTPEVVPRMKFNLKITHKSNFAYY